MRVLKQQSLADQRIRRLSKYTLGALAMTAMAYGAFKLWPGQTGYWIALAALSSAFAFKEFITAMEPWLKGDEGERKTLRALEELSDDYSVVTNFIVPGTEQGDIDLLVFGPHGVLVVEVKQYEANYACEGDDWFNVKDNGYCKRMKSPSRQLKRNVKAMQKHLKSLGASVDIHSVLVVPRRAKLKASNPTVPIVAREALREHINNLPQRTPCDMSVLRLAGAIAKASDPKKGSSSPGA